MSEPRPSFAGYHYQQRLSTGVIGEVFRALGGAGVEVRILHVAPALVRRAGFVEELMRFAAESPALDHPRVVGLRHVGRSGPDLAVVTDAVSGAVPLADLLSGGDRPPPDIAMALAFGAVEGLAHAHSLGVVHGLVAPRSVLIDFHGGVRLADFGVARAIAAVAARERDRVLLGPSGAVPPELLAGGPPSVASDVFGAGALLHHVWSGGPPPGRSAAPPAIAGIIARALAPEPARRPVNATELEELLEEAIIRDGCRVAPPDEVARYVSDQLAAPGARERARTGGQEAGAIAQAAPVPHEPDRARAASDETGILDAATSDLVAELARPQPGVRPARRRGVSEVLAGLEEESTGVEELTEVDPRAAEHGAGPDPISEILKLEDLGEPAAARQGGGPPATRAGAGRLSDYGASAEEDPTPLPRPGPPEPGSVTRHLASLDGAPPVPAAPAVSAAVPTAPAVPAAPRVDPLAGADPVRRPRSVLPWLALTVLAAGVLGAFLYTQTDLFDPGRRAAAERAEERAREEAIARHEAAQPVPVDLTITSPEPDAAVWLSLGRTPLESFPLSSAMVHELRFEHEGYRPLDLRVTGYEWKGEGGTLRAELHGVLTAGEPDGPVPAYAPATSSAPPAGPKGRGVVRITSEPPGAQVWLLIGFTPRTTITGLEAGHDREIKVLKDGFRPGFAAVRAEDWYLSGTREGTVRPAIERAVELVPAAPADRAGKPRKKSDDSRRRGR